MNAVIDGIAPDSEQDSDCRRETTGRRGHKRAFAGVLDRSGGAA